MATLYGDGAGKVLEIREDIDQPGRCEYEDEYGRCKNDQDDGDIFCPWHRELVMLRFSRLSSEIE